MEVAVAKLREEASEAVAHRRAKRIGSEFSSAESGGWPERYKEGCSVRKESGEERSWKESEERERERELFGELSFVEAGELSFVAAGESSRTKLERESLETRVRAPNDASQRDVHVQAGAPSPTPEELREAVALRGDARQGSRNSHFLLLYLPECREILWFSYGSATGYGGDYGG